MEQKNGVVVSMKRKNRSILFLSILKKLYILLVFLSVLIVMTYIIFKICVRPPQIEGPSSNTQDSLHTSSESASDISLPEIEASNTERKELCYTFLLVASDKSGLLADVIMVVKYDTVNQEVGVISIPRDTLVDPNDIAWFPKINSSYGGDITNLKAIIVDMLGIPIDFFVTVDVEGFVELIDSIGGVDFNVPIHMSYDDPLQGLSIHYEPGLQHLTGQQALEVCRLRYNQDGTLAYPDYDIGRTNTQRDLLLAVAQKVLKHPEKIASYIEIWLKYVTTNLSFSNILWFAESALDLDISTGVKTTALPGNGNVTCNGIGYCYQLYPDQVLEIVNDYVNPYQRELTPSDLNIYEVN